MPIYQKPQPVGPTVVNNDTFMRVVRTAYTAKYGGRWAFARVLSPHLGIDADVLVDRLRNIERNKTLPKVSEARAIGQLLGVDPDLLLALALFRNDTPVDTEAAGLDAISA